MKTSRIIFMLALAAAATACNKAELEGTDPAGLKSNQFLASIEGASTKVTMAEDFSLSWVAGDQVSVFESEAMKNELFTATEGGHQTTLDGGEVTVDQEKTYYAVYPYSEKNSLADGIITTEIPTVQTPKQGDIPVNIAVAKNDGQIFTFYNVCGLVGFNITTDNIKSVTVKSNDSSDYLTGLISVRQEEMGNPTYKVAGGQSYVTLEAETTFSTGYHYVAVLPQTFEKGITVVMTDSEDKVAQKTTTNPFTLNRSHRIDIKDIDASQTWGEKLTSISTAAELQSFLAVADKYAEGETVTLAADIDVKDCNLVPAASFAGIFNGADKSITNWNTTTALFEKLTGTVQNLVIGESCNLVVQANGDAAFIALENAGTISNCINHGTVTSVEESFVPDVKAQYNDRAIGTIAAVSTGSVVSCVNNGTVTITPATVGKYALQFIGGIAGKASASAGDNAMDSCTNNGAVTFDGPFSSKLFIGGVCGGTPAGAGTFGDYGVFKTLKNTAPVTLQVPTPSSVASTYINLGGVIGYAEADLDDCDNDGAVTVDVPKAPASTSQNMQRPAIAGVAGAGLYNVSNCDNTGALSVSGAFASIEDNSEFVGAGKYGCAAFGGVVAIAGTNATSHKVNTCTNSGRLDLNITMHEETKDSHGNIGGVVGRAQAQILSCSCSGEGLFIKNVMQVARVGGVAGIACAKMQSCTNSSQIDYDMVVTEQTGNQCEYIHLGGVVGVLDTGAGEAIIASANTGNITVKNGYYSGKISSIGGLVGKNQYGVVRGNKTSKIKISGTYKVNSPAKIYFGGIVGYNEGSSSTSSKKGLTGCIAQFSREGITEIEGVGEGSRIGGICGFRKGTIALSSSGVDWDADNAVNLVANDNNNYRFVARSGSDDVYAGLFYGEVSLGTGTHTMHGCTLNTSTFATDQLTDAGLAIGKISDGSVQFGIEGSAFTLRQVVFGGEEYNTTMNLTSDLLVGSIADGATVSVVNSTITPR